MNKHTLTYAELKGLCLQKLEKNGLNKNDAEIIAECYATADLYGVSSHGVAILPSHIKRIQKGGYNLNPKIHVEKSSSSFAVINSDNAIGPISASFCTKKAIDLATTQGIGVVFTHHANTYGPAFIYALMMAEKGLIGITCCNSPSAMPAPNGKEKLLGTNPLAIVTPTKSDTPIIYDIATSIVAKSKINQIRIAEGTIPEGWALDKNGNPTTDPTSAIEGLVLPMSGFKGYGLAMMIDILAGVLSGAFYLNQVNRFYTQDCACMNVGQFYMAIDPVAIFGANFYETMLHYISTIRTSEKIDKTKPIALPGDDRLQNARHNRSKGIEISEELYEFLTNN